ncbi:LANO_0G01310g1_1 [Lachancea nothofagi CBS 11611]|uniref:LANO_0G01310g1_1 n=1 Tax=Lachancea nothofagi CBS 11611 TaxID=1266666 RepID=A0A1G4KER1_9SACH|nr:LANO_0G01310g1_1 [Lachancea nothofagi CBS 11611]
MDSYERKIGCFIQIPNVGRGQLKYVGSVEGKPGTFVGVDLLANIGKNDGTFQGKRYFETEYTQSGLFIQLQKVSGLIDAATNGGSSRRSTFGDAHSGSRPATISTTVPRSPTPVRTASRHSSTAFSDAMDVDGEDRRHWSSTSTSSSRPNIEFKFHQQTQELSQCKKLLSEQRIVLEEIQPAIDDYEAKLQEMEIQIGSLQAQLAKERESQSKQKQYFETEHEQLLSVVEELHMEIRENEKRMLDVRQLQQAENALPTDSTIAELQAENDSLREKLDTLKEQASSEASAAVKWEKERDQLRLQNESLSSEYQYISKELRETQMKLSEAQTNVTNMSPDPNPEIEKLKLQLATANAKLITLESPPSPQPSALAPTTSSDPTEHETESLPLYIPKKADRAAGRQKWCALCERDGHNSLDCPYENDQLF